jgi:hypothetical protein
VSCDLFEEPFHSWTHRVLKGIRPPLSFMKASSSGRGRSFIPDLLDMDIIAGANTDRNSCDVRARQAEKLRHLVDKVCTNHHSRTL